MNEHASRLEHFEKPALIAGIIGLALCLVGAFLQPTAFYRSYLVAFVFWTGISLGALALLMLQYMTGGMWGILIRRPLESATKTLPLMVLAFLPIVLGMRTLYEWARPEVVAHDALLQAKAPYLNVSFFLGRTTVYFVLWLALAYLLSKWDRKYEETGDPWIGLRLRRVSAGGLLIMAITMTFASVDWMMSLEPHWFSTMYGISFMVGTMLSALTFSVFIMVRYADLSPLADVARPSHFRDLGNLSFAFTMLWAYTAFSQFLLIWYGNLKEETPWYLARTHGVWGVIAVLLIVFHFFAPFFLLLIRDVKDRARRLGVVVGLILVMRFVDLYWLITPAFTHGEFHIHWLHFASLIGLGGVWVYVFLRRLKEEPLLPMYEPQVQEALTHG